MVEAETQSIYDLEHLPGHKEIQRPKYAVKYWPQSETCQRNPRKYVLVAKSDSQRTIRNLTLPWLKPRDSCELGLLGFRRYA